MRCEELPSVAYVELRTSGCWRSPSPTTSMGSSAGSTPYPRRSGALDPRDRPSGRCRRAPTSRPSSRPGRQTGRQPNAGAPNAGRRLSPRDLAPGSGPL